MTKTKHRRLSGDDLEARMLQILAQEVEGPQRWCYCSFADHQAGDFLGAIVIEAGGMVHAAIKACMLGIDPDGDMITVAIEAGAPLPAENDRNRLLSRADLERIYGKENIFSLEEPEGTQEQKNAGRPN